MHSRQPEDQMKGAALNTAGSKIYMNHDCISVFSLRGIMADNGWQAYLILITHAKKEILQLELALSLLKLTHYALIKHKYFTTSANILTNEKLIKELFSWTKGAILVELVLKVLKVKYLTFNSKTQNKTEEDIYWCLLILPILSFFRCCNPNSN